MAGENIQLAQNTDAGMEVSIPEGTVPVDSALDPNAAPVDGAAPGDVGGDMGGDAGLLDLAPVEDASLDTGLAPDEAANPYGLAALWAQGDFVARGTLIILVLMSLYSWFIIFTKLWEQARLLRQAKEAGRDFWTGNSLNEGLQKLTGKGNVFRAMVESGLKASDHHEGKITQQVPLAEWISGQAAAEHRPHE